MGRPGTNNYEMTGLWCHLAISSGDTNFWNARPTPPQLTGTYSLVLNFAVTSGNVNATAEPSPGKSAATALPEHFRVFLACSPGGTCNA